LVYKTYGSPDDARLIGVTDAHNQSWSYSYDVTGALAQVTGPGLTRTWNYNQATHRLDSETHPESGTTTYLRYDGAGNLEQKRDARGTVSEYIRDGNNRVVQVKAGPQVWTTTYERGSDLRLTMTAPGVSTRYDYEAATGRVSGRTDVIGGKSFRVAYTYDANDNVATILYPSGRQVGYTYDSANRISSVVNARDTSKVHADSFQYHPSGGLTSYRAGNNVETVINYHPQRYWVSQITVGGSSLNAGFSYSYSAVGNVMSIGDVRGGSANQSFGYDLLDRLTTANGPWGTQDFDYDAHGNRTSTSTFTYNYETGKFRLAEMGPPGSLIAMTYDPNGNMVTGPQSVYSYSPANQLSRSTVAGTTVDFSYDGDGQRAKKSVVNGVTTYTIRGVNGELLEEWQNTMPTEVKDHIYAGSRLISVWTATTLPAK
jgi:YD repeat-containing protein